jgi:hypothetical protein
MRGSRRSQRNADEFWEAYNTSRQRNQIINQNFTVNNFGNPGRTRESTEIRPRLSRVRRSDRGFNLRNRASVNSINSVTVNMQRSVEIPHTRTLPDEPNNLGMPFPLLPETEPIQVKHHLSRSSRNRPLNSSIELPSQVLYYEPQTILNTDGSLNNSRYLSPFIIYYRNSSIDRANPSNFAQIYTRPDRGRSREFESMAEVREERFDDTMTGFQKG